MSASSGAPPRSSSSLSERGRPAALLFALLAERLNGYYEHGQWMSIGQTMAMARDWLTRDRRFTLSETALRALVNESDDMARQMAATLSREAGLLTTHHMMEALDPNHALELADTLMAQCAERVAQLSLSD